MNPVPDQFPAAEDLKTVSNSMLYMWRCVICIAHADKIMHAEERAYLVKTFDRLSRSYGLTPDQRALLDGDMDTPRDIADLLPHINDPEYRAMLITFGETLARIDGLVSPDEAEILNRLKSDQLVSVDTDALRKEIRATIAARRAERDAEMAEIHKEAVERNPYFAAVDKLMLGLGIHLLK